MLLGCQISFGPLCRQGGHQGYRQRDNEGRGQHKEGHAEGVLSIEFHRLCRGVVEAVLQRVEHQRLIHQRNYAHAHGGNGDGHAAGDQLVQNLPTRSRSVGPRHHDAAITQHQHQQQKGQGQRRAYCYAENGGGSTLGTVGAAAQEIGTQAEADAQLSRRLDDLAHRRGGHLVHTLCVAANSGGEAHAHHGGGQGADGHPRIAVLQKVGKSAGKRKHQCRTDKAYQSQQPQGGGKHTLRLPMAA